jgi:thiol-disulfide isomerase/thioredoxin
MTSTYRRTLLAGLLFLALCSIAGCPWLFGHKKSRGQAADFSYTTFKGESGSLSALRGQPLVLNFWAAWCGPCVGEFPEFQQVYNEHAGQFRLLSVAVDDNSDPRALVLQQGYSWDFASTTDDISSLYGISAIPLTLFIDARGRIVDQQLGGMDRSTFEEKLAKIL